GLTANRILVQEEYQIEGTDVNDIHEVSPILSGDIELKAYQKDSTEITAELVSAGGGAVEFPLFAFDGYKAELDGHEIAIARGDNNRIRVEIPAGASGQLRIWFEGKLLWRIADAVSLGAAAALCAYVIRKRKNEFAR
ncbi:MAG: hypothetical protein IJ337_06390, partial [Clostridia bacterium]|nr:hypothetical protein [Clostridia bacterium]